MIGALFRANRSLVSRGFALVFHLGLQMQGSHEFLSLTLEFSSLYIFNVIGHNSFSKLKLTYNSLRGSKLKLDHSILAFQIRQIHIAQFLTKLSFVQSGG